MPDVYISNANPDVVELPKAFDGPPEALHGAQIDYAGFNDNPALKRASEAIARGWDEGAAINELRQNPHEDHRAATHDRAVRERADNAQQSWVQQFDSAWAELKAEYRRVEAALDEKAGLKPEPAHFNAIIGTLQGIPVGERVKAIGDMIERGSHAVLATIIAADPFLTGIPLEVRDQIKTRVLQRVDPQGLKLRDHLAKSLNKMDAASLASIRMFEALRSGTAPGAWKDRAAKAAARNMAANFGQR